VLSRVLYIYFITFFLRYSTYDLANTPGVIDFFRAKDWQGVCKFL
jgi:hypothetical protein